MPICVLDKEDRQNIWRSEALRVMNMKFSERCCFLWRFGVYSGQSVSEESPFLILITGEGFTQTSSITFLRNIVIFYWVTQRSIPEESHSNREKLKSIIKTSNFWGRTDWGTKLCLRCFAVLLLQVKTPFRDLFFLQPLTKNQVFWDVISCRLLNSF